MNKSSAIALLTLLLLTELILRWMAIPAFLLPLPSQVFQALLDNAGDLVAATQETLSHAAQGLALSFLVGLTMALFISLSKWLRGAILPVALFFQMVPIIAIAPMLVIWFGYGGPSVVAAAAIVSFFPILASSLQGLDSAPLAMQELLSLYGASKWEIYLKLKIPKALPFIFNGVKISLGLAVVGTLVGEFIGGGGLGSLIDSARTQQRADLVFAAVLSSSLIGWIMNEIWDKARTSLLKKWFY